MKIIDRYLLRSLLMPLVFCLLAFTMVYVIADLFNHFSDFVGGGTSFVGVMRFYLLIIPAAMIFICPVSMLLAVLYSLSSLTRHNELTAMRACGVSLYRLMIPFAAVGLFLALLVSLVHETVGPWSAYWTQQFIAAQRSEDAASVYVTRDLAYRNEPQQRTWLVRSFDTRTFDLQGIELVQHHSDGTDAFKIIADSGHWWDGRWWFRGVLVQHYDAYGNPRGAPVRERGREMNELTETPNNFLTEVKEPEFLSARELRRYLDARSLSPPAEARILVDYHHRLAMPWMSLVVAFLGIPFGHHTGRRGALLGTALSLSLFFAAYVLINVGLLMGKSGAVAPWIGAWGPILVFTAIGLTLTARMQ